MKTDSAISHSGSLLLNFEKADSVTLSRLRVDVSLCCNGAGDNSLIHNELAVAWCEIYEITQKFAKAVLPRSGGKLVADLKGGGKKMMTIGMKSGESFEFYEKFHAIEEFFCPIIPKPT